MVLSLTNKQTNQSHHFEPEAAPGASNLVVPTELLKSSAPASVNSPLMAVTENLLTVAMWL